MGCCDAVFAEQDRGTIKVEPFSHEDMVRKARELARLRRRATEGPLQVVPLSGYGAPYSIRGPFGNGRTWYVAVGVNRIKDANLFAAAPEMAELLDIMADVLEKCID